MAAGDGHVPNNFKEQLLLGVINCTSHTFRLALFNKAYSSSQLDGAATYGVSPWDTDEISVTGYTAGGQSVGTCVVTQDDANDRAAWDDDGTDVTWTSLGSATIQTAVLYDDSTTPKHICIIWEIGTNSNGGNYTIQFHANGMLTLS